MNALKPPFRGAGDIQRQHGEPSSWIDSYPLLITGLCIALSLLWARSQGWI